MRAAALLEIASEHTRLPRRRDGLTALPRVGGYVADATLPFAGVEQRPILDRNVRRVYDRVFGDEFPGPCGSEYEFA